MTSTRTLVALLVGLSMTALPSAGFAQDELPPSPSPPPATAATDALPPPPPPAPVEPAPPPPPAPPPVAVEAAPPPAPPPPAPPPRPRRKKHRQAPSDADVSTGSFVAAGLYPGTKLGYISGNATYASIAGAQTDASGMVLEPHIDGVLTFGGVVGLGVSGGYLLALADGLDGWTFTPFAMISLTSWASLKANFGIVSGSVDHSATETAASPATFDTTAMRYGGGLFFIVSSSSSMDVGLGVEVLHMQSPKDKSDSYSGTGGFLDLAISFSP